MNKMRALSSSTMRKIIYVLASAVLVCGTFLTLVFHNLRVLKSSAPPQKSINFQEYLARMPGPSHLRIFEHSGGVYIEALGQLPKGTLFYAASGPPSYIFDSNGQLIEWTQDRGDSRAYTAKWGSFGNGTNVSVSQVVDFLQKN